MRWTRSRSKAALAGAAILIVTMLAVGSAPVASASTRDTKIVKGVVDRWSPATVRISAGDVVKWKAVSGSHTVTAYGRGWTFNHSLGQGTSLTHRFSRAGTFRFRCLIHSTLVNGVCSGMCGKVVVS